MARSPRVVVPIGDRRVDVTHPDKVLFPRTGHTKLDLVTYYIAVADGALRAAGRRPHQLVRYPDGVEGDHFYQKRAPQSRPAWIDTVTLRFPSGRQAEEVVPSDAAALAWLANLGCLELHPHAVRATDLDHPDELRIDLDPVPGVSWPSIVRVAEIVDRTLEEHGLRGFPKTSGSRGVHILVRIEARWGFDDVRRAALALAREVERQAPRLASSAWWKEERHGVFIDYNQNAKDRTTAAAYSVRPTPDARVSAPVDWQELQTCDPAEFTLATMTRRFLQLGDRHASIDDVAGSLESLLELADIQAASGLGDAPWPPHHSKRPQEQRRAPPSRRATARSRRVRHPLIVIARAGRRDDALAGLGRWKDRHPELLPFLQPSDVLVDDMRGRWRTWTRVRIDLQHVPEKLRPPPEPPDPDEGTTSR